MTDEQRKKSRVSLVVQEKSMAMANKSLGRSISRMKMRRMSFGFGGIAGIKIQEKISAAIESKRPPLLYANTYQLDPHPHQVFNIPKVTEMINGTFNNHWTGHKYNMSESPALALRIAGETMRKVKEMKFNRYRVISVVTIGEKRAQSYNNAITFLWDHERDRYVDVQRESITNFIQVTIFGVYLD